jgi:hypothetical protein
MNQSIGDASLPIVSATTLPTSRRYIAAQSFMTHCQRELLHAQWKILLDDEFLEAYEHGIIIECCDGIKRRFYFRIFTYAADYPEKYVHLWNFWNLSKLMAICLFSQGYTFYH